MTHIAILDIGKTNKKCFVFNEDYQIVFEQTSQLPETTDEDGDPCEDLDLLTNWVLTTVRDILNDVRFQIKAVNCTAYGASFVHLNAEGLPVAPLYNYLKIFPEELKKQFLETYGPVEKITLETASPMLGMLNSGLQLYWLKYYKPVVFKQIKYSLHLPQYVAFLVPPHPVRSLPEQGAGVHVTSLGCHTMLWDFQKNDYHDWVKAEDLVPSHPVRVLPEQGAGIHDSSAALIPYLASFEEPFVLISTGTWCISLNPFNQEPLTAAELAHDCLCYLSYEGKPVKAARYFGGDEHEKWIKHLAEVFNKPLDYYQQIIFDQSIIKKIYQETSIAETNNQNFDDYETAYHIIMTKIIKHQYNSTKLVITKTTQSIFVDGGFSKNEIYMHLLARAFPTIAVFAAEVAQATALGAALAVHSSWNQNPWPTNLISLKKYTAIYE